MSNPAEPEPEIWTTWDIKNEYIKLNGGKLSKSRVEIITEQPNKRWIPIENYAKLKAELSERQDKLNHLIADEVSYRQEIAKLKAELAEKSSSGYGVAIDKLKQQLAEKDNELKILRDLRLLYLKKETSSRDFYLENIGRNKDNAEWKARVQNKIKRIDKEIRGLEKAKEDNQRKNKYIECLPIQVCLNMLSGGRKALQELLSSGKEKL